MLKTFRSGYAAFFEPYDHARDFLKTVDSYIHVEVYKLYPDAELPSIKVEDLDDDSFKLIYSSSRALGHLALGLIEATFELYKKRIPLTWKALLKRARNVNFSLQTDLIERTRSTQPKDPT